MERLEEGRCGRIVSSQLAITDQFTDAEIIRVFRCCTVPFSPVSFHRVADNFAAAADTSGRSRRNPTADKQLGVRVTTTSPRSASPCAIRRGMPTRCSGRPAGAQAPVTVRSTS
jgi:hypothetical protein